MHALHPEYHRWKLFPFSFQHVSEDLLPYGTQNCNTSFTYVRYMRIKNNILGLHLSLQNIRLFDPYNISLFHNMAYMLCDVSSLQSEKEMQKLLSYNFIQIVVIMSQHLYDTQINPINACLVHRKWSRVPLSSILRQVSNCTQQFITMRLFE